MCSSMILSLSYYIFMCSKCYHSLVQFVMGSESTSDMAAKEQAWNVLEEILGLLDQSKVL